MGIIKECGQELKNIIAIGQGVLSGAPAGVVQAALLPTYLRMSKQPNSSARALELAPQFPFHYASEVEKFSGASLSIAAQLSRVGATVSMAADLTDGSPENFGYLAFTNAVSLAYEGFKHFKDRHRQSTLEESVEQTP